MNIELIRGLRALLEKLKKKECRKKLQDAELELKRVKSIAHQKKRGAS